MEIGEGRIEIYSGTDARSADVRIGDTFTVTKEDENWYQGSLNIKGSFEHHPGLSGKDVSGYTSHRNVIFLLRKKYVTNNSDDFWATWKQI